MKTHELADLLERLAKILRGSPNSDVENLPKLVIAKQPKISEESTELGLRTLVRLAKLDKRQWIALINKYDLSIKLNPRDSSRDVLGKILRYLDNNEEAYQDFEKKLTKTSGSTSEPLEDMLRLLMKKD